MEQNPKYARVTTEHLSVDLSEWCIEFGLDKIADSLVKNISDSDMSMMMLRKRIGREICDVELHAHIRRAWSYLKEIYGEYQAQVIVSKAGTITIIGAIVMLDNVSRTKDAESLNKLLSTVAFVPTLSTNVVDLIAEFNGIKGDQIIPWITEVVPMTDNERSLLIEKASVFDYSQKHVH